MRMQLKSCFRRSMAVVAMAAGVLAASHDLAVGSDWINGAGGDYHTSGNWSAGVPNAAGATADFGTLDFAATSVSTWTCP